MIRRTRIAREGNVGRRRRAGGPLQLQDAAFGGELPADRVKLTAFGSELAFACIEFSGTPVEFRKGNRRI